MSDQSSRIGEEPGANKSDPTALTTDALHREIAQQYKLIFAEMATIRQAVADQKELRIAQIANLQQQIVHAEKLRMELKTDNEKNIEKALTGVEKANDKLESTFTRSLSQLSERLNDNKDRLTALEQQKIGAKEDRTGLYAALGALLLLLSIGGIIAGVLANAAPG